MTPSFKGIEFPVFNPCALEEVSVVLDGVSVGVEDYPHPPYIPLVVEVFVELFSLPPLV